MRSHKIYWDLTRSTVVSQDLQRSQKVHWFGSMHLISNMWHLTFDIECYCHDIWHLTLICHGIWYLRYAMTFDIDIWHLTLICHAWHLTFDILHWYTMTLDIWHWYAMTFDISERTDTYDNHIFTDGFWGYMQSQKLVSHWTILV